MRHNTDPFRLFIGILLILLPLKALAGPDAADNSFSVQIDDHAERALSMFSVPGVAVAVVKDGRIVHTKGYGLRDVQSQAPVTEDTVFQIASLTKAFTTAALSLLVEEGKLHWDDKVIDHLPDFRLNDPYVTREFTIRDLLTHRGGLGLGSGDLLFWPDSQYGDDDVLNALKYFQPVSSFRSKYAYHNLFYIVAGILVEAASGEPWDQFVEQRLFKPLNMKQCAPSIKSAKRHHNRATPYMNIDGALSPTFYAQDNPSAAVSISCSAEALAEWCPSSNNLRPMSVVSNGVCRLAINPETWI